MPRQALAAIKRRTTQPEERLLQLVEDGIDTITDAVKPVTGELVAKPEVSYDKLLKQLPPQRRRFVQEYLVDVNGTQAAIRAGYSEKTAKIQASQLLTNINVSQTIEAGHDRLAELVKVRQYEVVREFRRIGFADMRDFSKWGPGGVKLTDSEKLTPEQTACVAEVSQTITENGGSIKFRLHSKVDALNSLAKHLGMFPTRVEQGVVQVPVQFNIVIRPTQGQE